LEDVASQCDGKLSASLPRLMDGGQEVETAAARCKAARTVENEVLHAIADSERELRGAQPWNRLQSVWNMGLMI